MAKNAEQAILTMKPGFQGNPTEADCKAGVKAEKF